MNYWLADNREMAEGNALHMLIGLLEYSRDHGLPVAADDLLEFIKKSIQEEEERLNQNFPNKARMHT